jgi:2-oxoisovalerate dehydrogenase E2 component (dihydrolipoyl transacylase)
MAVREFLLPDLGEGLEDAEVVSWRVAEGDRVELNQTLVEVNTAKALVEVPAPWEGVVEKLHAGEGDVVKVGAPLVSIRVEEPAEASADASPSEAQQDRKPKRRAVLVGYGVEEEEPSATARARRVRSDAHTEPVRASPPVRRLARELGIDLATVQPSGPDGRITREDVVRASGGQAAPDRSQGAASLTFVPTGAKVEDRPPMGGDVSRIPVRGTRRLIAEKMARSAREIPHVTTFLTVDASWLQAFRAEIESASGQKVSPLPIVVRALVEVVTRHRKLNSSFVAERSEIAIHAECNVGIATDTEEGLLVPVIHHADRRGILDIASEISRLAEAARAKRIKLEDMTGGTITVTNVGSFGAEYGTPIINHPEAAILAFGVIEPRALVVGTDVMARPAVTISLTFDHRVMDGAEAGRALKDLGTLLENPLQLGSLPR